MGSSGSGKFGTYRIGGNSGTGGSGTGTGTGGIGGVGTGEIECPKILENISLEDVATSEFYVNHRSLPAAGDAVSLRNKIHNGRLVVEKSDTKEILGNLPTQYNNLVNCIKKGMHYSGGVVAAGDKPIPFVVVTLNA
jgi:hypothetical protein